MSELKPEPALDPTRRVKSLLLVDDEPNIRNALKRLFRQGGYNILTAEGAEEALEVLEQNDVNVVISDQRMPGLVGHGALEQGQGDASGDGAHDPERVRRHYPDHARHGQRRHLQVSYEARVSKETVFSSRSAIPAAVFRRKI
jgi:CheY-like chemotaxis protein